MLLSWLKDLFVKNLSDRYGAAEAAAQARVVWEDAFGRQNLPIEAVQEQTLAILERLRAGEPVQYVLGRTEFFGNTFLLSPAVLIPRQETEELVAWALDFLRKSTLPNPAVLDIGLGSGCIGISLIKAYPGAALYGLEKSPEALAVARDNAGRLLGPGAYTFIEGDALDPAVGKQFPALDLIVSNPPYIPLRERDLMPPHVLEHEPHTALFVPDEDSLVFYRAIGRLALDKLRPGGALFFECNQYNAYKVAGVLQDMGFKQVEVRQDVAGADRMILAKLD